MPVAVLKTARSDPAKSSKHHSAKQAAKQPAKQQSSPNKEGAKAEDSDGDEDDYITRCICGFDHDDGFMICCDQCSAWQHVICVGLDKNHLPNDYLCELCKPRPLDVERARLIQSTKAAELVPGTSSGTSSSEEEDDAPDRKTAPIDPQMNLFVSGCLTVWGRKQRLSALPDEKLTPEFETDPWVHAKAIPNAGGNQALYARRPLTADVLCTHYRGKFMLRNQYEKQLKPDQLIQHEPHQFMWFHPSLDLCIDARKEPYTSDTKYVRRSCTPTALTRDIAFKGKRGVGIFPITDLPVGAEVTIPFDFDYTEATYNLPCACKGSTACPVRNRTIPTKVKNMKRRASYPRLEQLPDVPMDVSTSHSQKHLRESLAAIHKTKPSRVQAPASTDTSSGTASVVSKSFASKPVAPQPVPSKPIESTPVAIKPKPEPVPAPAFSSSRGNKKQSREDRWLAAQLAQIAKAEKQQKPTKQIKEEKGIGAELKSPVGDRLGAELKTPQSSKPSPHSGAKRSRSRNNSVTPVDTDAQDSSTTSSATSSTAEDAARKSSAAKAKKAKNKDKKDKGAKKVATPKQRKTVAPSASSTKPTPAKSSSAPQSGRASDGRSLRRPRVEGEERKPLSRRNNKHQKVLMSAVPFVKHLGAVAAVANALPEPQLELLKLWEQLVKKPKIKNGKLLLPQGAGSGNEVVVLKERAAQAMKRQKLAADNAAADSQNANPNINGNSASSASIRSKSDDAAPCKHATAQRIKEDPLASAAASKAQALATDGTSAKTTVVQVKISETASTENTPTKKPPSTHDPTLAPQKEDTAIAMQTSTAEHPVSPESPDTNKPSASPKSPEKTAAGEISTENTAVVAAELSGGVSPAVRKRIESGDEKEKEKDSTSVAVTEPKKKKRKMSVQDYMKAKGKMKPKDKKPSPLAESSTPTGVGGTTPVRTPSEAAPISSRSIKASSRGTEGDAAPSAAMSAALAAWGRALTSFEEEAGTSARPSWAPKLSTKS